MTLCFSGKPSSMYERSNPDWAPTLLLGEDLTPSKSLKKEKKIETNKKGTLYMYDKCGLI